MGSASESAAARELEARLHRPERGENGYREGAEARTRLEALQRLREMAEAGRIAFADLPPGGVNTHVHTAKSFAFFDSPCDAVWQAYRSRLQIFGINDHYTLAGHEEFGKACRIASIRPTFSLEAIAQWEEARQQGKTVNDPTNPGRTYLTAKGVTRAFADGSGGARDLAVMNTALRRRHEAMALRLAEVFRERLELEGAVTWEGVLLLTPHGQPTERHLALAAASALEARFPELEARREAAQRLLDSEVSSEALGSAAAFQDLVRARLIKAGRPAYVPEDPEAFVPVERLVSLALDLGAIPTYPVLGDPVTPWEQDLDRLFDRLEALGVHAVEVIPDRNRRERLREIVEMAAARGFPVFNGTEHNTKTPMPLVDRYFFDPEFQSHFLRGAKVLLGHQALRAAGEDGLVRDDGSLPPGGRVANLERVAEAWRRRAP